jgi:hypothetical protein
MARPAMYIDDALNWFLAPFPRGFSFFGPRPKSRCRLPLRQRGGVQSRDGSKAYQPAVPVNRDRPSPAGPVAVLR